MIGVPALGGVGGAPLGFAPSVSSFCHVRRQETTTRWLTVAQRCDADARERWWRDECACSHFFLGIALGSTAQTEILGSVLAY